MEPAFDCVRIVDRWEGLVARDKQRIAFTRGTRDDAVLSGIAARARGAR